MAADRVIRWTTAGAVAGAAAVAAVASCEPAYALVPARAAKQAGRGRLVSQLARGRARRKISELEQALEGESAGWTEELAAIEHERESLA